MAKPLAKLGWGCLVLFALPFLGAGLFVGGRAVIVLFEWRDARTWEETTAKLQAAELERHRGDDSVTYEATARYTYQYNNREFTGTRVALHTSADNLGTFQQDMAKQLKKALLAGKVVPCYVNPAAPEQALLNRELRLEMLGLGLSLGGVFTAVGLGLIVFAATYARHVRKVERLKAQHPDEPWNWQEAWQRGEYTSSTRRSALAWTLGGSIGLALTSPFLLMAREGLGKGNYWHLVSLAVAGLMIAAVLWGLRLCLQWLRYGTSTLQLATHPVSLGGPLVAVLHTTASLPLSQGLKQRLECRHRYTTGSGDNRSQVVDILWEEERFVEARIAETDAGGEAYPVEFGVPYDVRPTTMPTGGDGVTWLLTCTAATPGVDYAATFELPVFKTNDSDPNYVARQQREESETQETPIERVYQSTGATREETIDGLRITFSLRRNLANSWTFGLFLLLWLGVTTGLIYGGAPWIFRIVWSAFSVLFVWLWLDMTLNVSDLIIDDRQLITRTGWFGLRRRRVFEAEIIRRIQLHSRMHSGGRKYYDLDLQIAGGKKFTLCKHILGKHPARLIADDIEHALGVKQSEAAPGDR